MKKHSTLKNVEFKDLQITDFVEEITNEVIHHAKVFADDQNHQRIHQAIEEVIRSYGISFPSGGSAELMKNKTKSKYPFTRGE